MRRLPRLVAETPVGKTVPVTRLAQAQQRTRCRSRSAGSTRAISSRRAHRSRPRRAAKDDAGVVKTLGLTLSDITTGSEGEILARRRFEGGRRRRCRQGQPGGRQRGAPGRPDHGSRAGGGEEPGRGQQQDRGSEKIRDGNRSCCWSSVRAISASCAPPRSGLSTARRTATAGTPARLTRRSRPADNPGRRGGRSDRHGRCRHRAVAATAGLAWKAIPIPAAASIGRSLAPSPTAIVCCSGTRMFGRQGEQRFPLGLAGHDRRPHGAGDAACRQIEPVGDDVVEPEFSGDRFGKDREPARDERGHRSGAAHRRDQLPGRPASAGCGRPPLRARDPADPRADATRASSAAAKSISPFIARRVISETCGRSPMKSASSSSISFSMIVDSISATRSRLRRSAAG